MITHFAPVLLTAGCLGAGTAILAVLRLPGRSSPLEHWTWAFAIGFGAIGWVLFFVAAAGFATPWPIAGAVAFCALGVFVKDEGRPRGRPVARFDGIEWLALGLLALAFAISVFEAVSPPTDADSLAYHFALPKQFLEAGRLVFVPRAIDGAAPLLPQMTYMAALAVGGERAMTLWVAITGWASAAVVYVVARRHLARTTAALLAVAFYTVPAVVYGAGSGQVEVKLAMFAALAAVAIAQVLRTGDGRFAILAGLCAGFFIGGKFTGLLFAACSLVVIVLQRNGWRHGALFAAAAFVAGFQWLAWNALNTGDPMFPMLFRWLPAGDSAIWSATHDAFFRAEWNGGELPLPKTLWELLAYPVRATFFPLHAFDAGRTGFGPLPVLFFPFAVAAAWRYRDRIAGSDLWPMAAVCLLYYIAWFFIGPSQRLRHLLPLLPILLIVLAVAARRWADGAACRATVALALGATIAIQGAGQIVYAKRYIERAISGESRESFLARSVAGYPAVAWINLHLPKDSRVATDSRQLIYLFDTRVFYAHPVDQAELELGPSATLSAFLKATRRLRVTHALAIRSIAGEPGKAGLSRLAEAAVAHGCGEIQAEIPISSIASRTLSTRRPPDQTAVVVRLGGPGCNPLFPDPRVR